MAAKNKPNELYLERVYDAPVKTVWDAWVDPKQVAKWWGPRGFTLTTKSKDVRTGGSWIYTMHGPDGVDYPNHTIYLEVEKYRRMVYDHGGNENQPPMFRVTVEFKELKGNKTKMEMTMALKSEEAAREAAKFIKSANGNSTWDRLAEFLAEENGKPLFVINHSFETSIETMYDVWTKPQHFAKWMGPAGSKMEALKGEIKPGNSLFYRMDYQGFTMYVSIHYLEFQRPDRLVYTQQFADEKGGLFWPETMRTTVLFAEEAPNQTRVTVIWEMEGQASHEEIEAFIAERAGMNQGWEGSFDTLEAYLNVIR